MGDIRYGRHKRQIMLWRARELRQKHAAAVVAAVVAAAAVAVAVAVAPMRASS